MSNPFGKLRIERDEDEILEQRKQQKEAQELFTKETAKPKRKVKPTENKKEEVSNEDTTTGFEKVGKAKKNVSHDDSEQIGNAPVQKERGKKFHQNRGDQTFRVNNKTRQFDRHESGTGRGKEIKKEGRGGKGTWEGHGVKREIQDYDNTDYHFNKALNPRKEKETKYVAEEVVVVEEKKEEVVVEVKTEEVVEQEAKPEKVKPKTKQDLLDEAEAEKNKLEVPEDALTLTEWKAKMNKTGLTADVAKNVEVKVDLDQFEARADETIGIANPKAKKNKGAKNTKVSQKDVDLNKMINLNIDDGNTRTYNNNKNYNNKGGKKFNMNDLPELK